MSETPHVVRFTVEYVKWLPDDWEQGTREYYMDETCAANIIADLGAMVETYDNLPDDCYDENGSMKQGPACFCACSKGEYLRPATADDLKRLPVVGGPHAVLERMGME